MVAAIYQGFIKDEAGNIIEGASVEVRDQDTNALVDLWSNRATTSTKTNPTTTDANGYYFFYRTAGRYKITVTSASYSATFNNVPIGTAQEYDTGSTTGLIPTVDDLATVAITGDYDDLINKPTLGTIVTYNYGTAGGEIQTNSLNDARFFRIGNNLSEGTASAMRANLQLGSGDDVTFNSITVTTTVDGRDVSADGAKLDGIEAGADVTDSTNVLSSLVGQALAVATIDTGQGAVECYAMDQPTRTTDTITVANASADGHALNRITADGRYGQLGSTNTWTGTQTITGAVDASTYAKVGSYTVAGAGTLGAATAGAGAIIYVTDETGGAVLAFSDGTDWRRVTDRAVIA